MKRQRIRLGIVIISFLLFPITIYYHSPALIVGGAAQGIIVGSFILFSLQFLSALFIGRAFCGWACAGAGLQDVCACASPKRARGGRLNWIKWFLWFPWISIIIFLAARAGGFSKIDPFYRTWFGVSLHDTESYIVYFFIVGLVAILAFSAGKRAFCHYVCWMAPFMIIGRQIRNIVKLPSLQLVMEREKCTNCKKCNRACPMSLEVNDMVIEGDMENVECILCGSCVDSCRENVIRYSFGIPPEKEMK